MSDRQLQTALLAEAGRLLLEFNESTGGIHRTLARMAEALTSDRCTVSVDYGGGERDALVATLLYLVAAAGSLLAIIAVVRL